EARAAKGGKGNGAAGASASIHDIVQVKEPGLAARLVYDEYERRSALLRILPLDMTPAAWGAGGRGELGDFADGRLRIVRLDADRAVMARDGAATIGGRSYPLSAETEVRVGGGRMDPS